MKTKSYHSEYLEQLFRKQKVTTLSEMKAFLGTEVDMTVFRKLKELEYFSSYSHRGKYYVLENFIRFNSLGLWSYDNIRFSKYKTLASTTEAFITNSDSGYYMNELDNILHVSTKKTLLQLSQKGKIVRNRITGFYLYCSSDPFKRKQQIAKREIENIEAMLGYGINVPQISKDELKSAIVLFFSLLNEKERRIYAGLESLRLGYGGDKKIAMTLGISAHTAAKGREQLLQGEIEPERIRSVGNGRKKILKKNTDSYKRNRKANEI